ncbi:hypothetical protein [Paenibacillus sp. PDC88]|uniref:hypothetical protein n=1 Tax=Paenibacillus sp. PDC88 TaxID=1884375 RepID=UPI00089877BE|nr:hypothetical protein [Paenibacillus sp. PDC88]SDW23562.1 hypothetical protein SAMN05518848_101743 [Paenibacillus sp. PDC88]
MSQFVEVSRTANVGERIKIVNAWGADGYKTGDVLTVVRVHGNGSVTVRIGSGTTYVSYREYVVLESVAPQSFFSTPIFEKFAQFLRDNADEVRKIIEEESQVEPVVTTPNNVLTRAKVIAQAKADVAELERIGRDIDARLPEDSPFHTMFYRVEFHVNREKRAVTALVHRTKYNGVITARNFGKNTAKCAPGEVFNAAIGKAIALRRALGLTVPNEYLNAPQPDEPRVGAVFTPKKTGLTWTSALKKREAYYDGTRYGKAWKHTYGSGWVGENQIEIIDDTDVDYADGTEVAA